MSRGWWQYRPFNASKAFLGCDSSLQAELEAAAFASGYQQPTTSLKADGTWFERTDGTTIGIWCKDGDGIRLYTQQREGDIDSELEQQQRAIEVFTIIQALDVFNPVEVLSDNSPFLCSKKERLGVIDRLSLSFSSVLLVQSVYIAISAFVMGKLCSTPAQQAFIKPENHMNDPQWTPQNDKNDDKCSVIQDHP